MALAYRVSHRCRIRQTVEKTSRNPWNIVATKSQEARGHSRVLEYRLLGISTRKNVCCPRDARKHNLRIRYANRYHRGNVNNHILS